MAPEPLIAIYAAYLRPALLEVYCFNCHRLIGASPAKKVAEMLQRLHTCK